MSSKPDWVLSESHLVKLMDERDEMDEMDELLFATKSIRMNESTHLPCFLIM